MKSISPIVAKFRELITLFVVLASVSVPLQAQILFTNGAATTYAGYRADSGYAYSESGNVFEPTLSGTTSLIAFNGGYENGLSTTDNFTISLYDTSAGAPDTLLTASTLSSVTRTPIPTSSGNSIYLFTATLDVPFTLSTGTSYYLGISDATDPYDLFFVAASDGGTATTEYSYLNGTGFLVETSEALAFTLGRAPVATPEPSTYAMLLGGLALLGFCLVRKRAAALPNNPVV